MTEERFEFTAGAKKKLALIAIVGVILFVIGAVFLSGDAGHHEAHDAAAHTVEGAHAEEADHGYHWTQRLYANLWINNLYFLGIALLGVFFVAIQYAAQAGWSAPIKRIPEAFGYWLPIAGVLFLAVFFLGGHDIFHWTHDYLYDQNDPRYDAIIDGKRAYLNTGFFLARMVAYFVLWFLMFKWMRNISLKEDLEGGSQHYFKLRTVSAFFIIIFAVTSSTMAWDWVLSIDTHWFSTMFGWYVFASMWVSALAAIALVVALLKERGYLKEVNSNHIHDLGKFVFAFSVFWAYIWFSQFMLIYYSNIPEETVYFVERISSDYYSPVFFMNLGLNFILPFLLFMTRESKRQLVFLKLVSIIVLVGHWFDFYLMVTPGTLQENGGFGLLEIGLMMIYGAVFVFVFLTNLAKAPLVAQNHPLMEEAKHHHI